MTITKHSGDPEQFWNCAEVTVLPRNADGSNDPAPHAAGTEICDGTTTNLPPPPSPTPPTPPTPTTSSPVAVGQPNNSEGYCNWGPLGTGLSSTCDGCVQGGSHCNGGAHQCESGEYRILIRINCIALHLCFFCYSWTLIITHHTNHLFVISL